MTFTDVFYGLTELGVLLIVGMIIRNKIKIFAKAYIPASVIGGVLGLILGPSGIGLNNDSRYVCTVSRAFGCSDDDFSRFWS